MPQPLAGIIRMLITTMVVSIVLVIIAVITSAILGGSLTPPVEYDDALVAQVTESREARLTPDNPPQYHRVVDYGEGTGVSWYPKGESPLLAELVTAGDLPPVEQRLGVDTDGDGVWESEPIVMTGPEGVGTYGGAWYRLSPGSGDLFIADWRMAGARFLRMSAQGDQIVPHLAKSVEVSDDGREITIQLRKGARWSDGHLMTVRDILFYREAALASSGAEPKILQVNGKPGILETIPLDQPLELEGQTFTFDPWTIKFVFPEPNGFFKTDLVNAQPYLPEHYLRPIHPKLGDPEAIAAKVEQIGAPGPEAMYAKLERSHFNVELPKMQAWIYRRHSTQAPWVWVRNPYFPAVDMEGQQLPYIDQVIYQQVDRSMLNLSAADGQATFQSRHLSFSDYTYLMSKSVEKEYRVLHWFPATRGAWTIFPNINRMIDPQDPQTEQKHALLNNRSFRQALSLAIDRQGIIDAEYKGLGEPAQLDPGAGSPYAHPALRQAWISHDPERANQLLDSIGLTNRDREGMRTFADGTRMTFYLNMTSDYSELGPAQFVIDDWAKVGVRLVLRDFARSLFDVERKARRHDFTVWSGESEFLGLSGIRNFVPINSWSCWAPGYGQWYELGGMFDDPRASDPTYVGAEKPDPSTENGRIALRLMGLLVEARQTPSEEIRRQKLKEIFDINAQECFTINIATPPPKIVVADKQLRNVPEVAIDAGAIATPVNAGFETWWLDGEQPFVGNKEAFQQLLIAPHLEGKAVAQDTVTSGDAASDINWLGVMATLFYWLVIGAVVLMIVMIAIKHPFVAHRLLWMIPTLAIMSIIIFTTIQLPPGDFLSNEIEARIMEGDENGLAAIEQKKELFHVDDHPVVQYLRWTGVTWFVGGEAGLLQGDLGLSMRDSESVNKKVGDRLAMTMIITLGSLVLTYVLALSTGIYAAVRQYSISDYTLSFIAIIGMCVPNFLLALLFIYMGDKMFGVTVTGLFSPEYAVADWSFGKVIDLLKHIWVAILVIGVGGTAGMMRIMRGNLLDELRKPYVTTARAKGVRPVKMILKYPVRLALNPFISGIGGIFPTLVSGAAIVAIVLNLPTVGPLMLEGLMEQDTYLAGSMAMTLSALGVFGTLVSDLLLLWVDPRIRMEGGTR